MTPTIELEYWQRRFGLHEWSISIRYGRVAKHHDAEIDYDARDMTAAVTIREGKTGDELSRLVMHELIHLIVQPMAARMVGRGKEKAEESVVAKIEAILGGSDD